MAQVKPTSSHMTRAKDHERLDYQADFGFAIKSEG